jgi:hypothetical protein
MEVREHDPERRQNILKVVAIAKIPRDVARKATDALSNIRHSFDQSIYAACRAIGKSPKDSIYFPWADSPTDLEYRLGAKVKPGKVPKIKIPPELWPRLRSFEPYGRGDSYSGGNDAIRKLAQIANRKHTVNLTFSPTVGHIRAPSFAGAGDLALLVPNWDPVKNEIVIARFSPEISSDYKYTLRADVAFDEPILPPGIPVLPALRFFLAKAQAVREGLEAEARKITGA